MKAMAISGVATLLFSIGAFAQSGPVATSQPVPTANAVLSYGAPISLDLARRIGVRAEAAARRINASVAISVVEPSGSPVWFERMDDASYSAVELALSKARTAATTKRPSQFYADIAAKGAVGILTLGLTLSGGGIPIIRNGKIIGAIGVSGGSAGQDVLVAEAAIGEP